MGASSDAADQIVKITLDGVQTAAKITGEGALELAKLLIRELKMPQQTKGRASLAKMMKSQKPIKVFEIDDKSLKKFCEEAKRYGVMYHVLKDKNAKNGKCDIMVRAEDASKVNRIFEKFKLGVNQKAVIKRDIEKSKKSDIPSPEKQRPEKSAEDRFIDELFSKPVNKEKTETKNPQIATTEKSRPSERSSKSSNSISIVQKGQNYSSVKTIIAEIKEDKAKSKTDKSTTKHKEPKAKSKPKRSNKDVRS